MNNLIHNLLKKGLIVVPREKGSQDYKFNIWNPMGLTFLFIFAIVTSVIEGFLLIFKMPYDIFYDVTQQKNLSNFLSVLLIIVGANITSVLSGYGIPIYKLFLWFFGAD